MTLLNDTQQMHVNCVRAGEVDNMLLLTRDLNGVDGDHENPAEPAGFLRGWKLVLQGSRGVAGHLKNILWDSARIGECSCI